MEKKLFDIILKSLNDRIFVCKTNFSNLNTKRDIENLSISEARRIRDLSIDELEKMTNVAMVEIYHIIGMGNLTMTQLATFVKNVKEYLSFRPILKTISSNLCSLDNVPEVPTGTTYHLSVLGDFWLTSGDGKSPIEDCSSIDEYNAKTIEKLKNTDVSFEIEGKTLKINKSEVENFCKNSSALGCGEGAKPETLLKKATNKGKYLGISWDEADSYIVGRVESNRVLEKLQLFKKVKQS